MGRGLRTGGRAFQSTLSLRRATFSFIFPLSRRGDFNPRSPCGERPPTHEISRRHAKFQSTLSLRRATVWLDGERMANVFQSTLSLRRATIQGEQFGWPVSHFNPRSPCGERLANPCVLSGYLTISIHALLAESDRTRFGAYFGSSNFNPRSPCGERLPGGQTVLRAPGFQSTLSLRRATQHLSAVFQSLA